MRLKDFAKSGQQVSSTLLQGFDLLLLLISIAFERGQDSFHLDEEFDAFCTKEVAAWREIGEQRTRNELVRPSGNFDSSIGHHLRCPSFSTKQAEQQETADNSKLSIGLVMQQDGFNHPGMLIYDHLARHEAKSEGLQRYPQKILQCLEDFLHKFRDCIKATVEIIYGCSVKQRVLRTLKLEEFRLWGEHRDISSFLEWTHDDAETRRVCRIIIFVNHPSYLRGTVRRKTLRSYKITRCL